MLAWLAGVCFGFGFAARATACPDGLTGLQNRESTIMAYSYSYSVFCILILIFILYSYSYSYSVFLFWFLLYSVFWFLFLFLFCILYSYSVFCILILILILYSVFLFLFCILGSRRVLHPAAPVMTWGLRPSENTSQIVVFGAILKHMSKSWFTGLLVVYRFNCKKSWFTVLALQVYWPFVRAPRGSQSPRACKS